MYKIKNFLSSGQLPEDFKEEINNYREKLLNYDVINKISYTIRYYVVLNGKSYCMLHCVHHKDIAIRTKLNQNLNLNQQFENFKLDRYSVSQNYFENFLSLVEDKYTDLIKTNSCVKAYQIAFFKALQYSSRTYVNFFKSLSFSKLFREQFSFVHGRFIIRNFADFPFEKKIFIRFNHLRDINYPSYISYSDSTIFDIEFNNLNRSLYKSYSNASFKAIQNIGLSKASVNRLFKFYMLQTIFRNTDLSYLYNEDYKKELCLYKNRFNEKNGNYTIYHILNYFFELFDFYDLDSHNFNKRFNKIKGYDSDLSYLISFLLNGSSKYQALENNFSNEEKEFFYQKCIDIYFYHLLHCFKENSGTFSFKVFFVYMVNIMNIKGLSFFINLEPDIKISLIMANKGIKNNNQLICSKENEKSALFIDKNLYFNNHYFSNNINFYQLSEQKQNLFFKILNICSNDSFYYDRCSAAIVEIIIYAEEISFIDLYKFHKRIIQKDNELNNELKIFVFNEATVSLFPDLFFEATGKRLLFKDGTHFIQGTYIPIINELDEDDIPF